MSRTFAPFKGYHNLYYFKYNAKFKEKMISWDTTPLVYVLYSNKRKSMGVNFVQEPDVQPWGTFAIIEDSEGNNLLLVQQPVG